MLGVCIVQLWENLNVCVYAHYEYINIMNVFMWMCIHICIYTWIYVWMNVCTKCKLCDMSIIV